MTSTSELKLVCLLDVLGFKSLFKRHGLAEMHLKYSKLIDYVKRQNGGLDVSPMPDGHVAVGWLDIGNAYFSDSLLFWTGYNKISLPSFTQCIAEVICFGLEIGLPLRGSIAVGEAILEKKSGIFLGEPLIEVSETERTQQWIGASFGPSFSKPAFNVGFYLHTVLPYKGHYKDSTSEYATGMTVDWPRQWRESRESSPSQILKNLNRDPKFSSYYERTECSVVFSKKTTTGFAIMGDSITVKKS